MQILYDVMIQKFVSRNGNGTLLLLFAGWGMDTEPFRDYSAPGKDIMVCYDYTDGTFDPGAAASYGRVEVVAWSMGVMAAADALPTCGLVPASAVALNGTPLPVDDAYGIPEAVFRGTLEGLSEASIVKFRRRMCGDAANFTAFSRRCPSRDAESLRGELAALGQRAAGRGMPAGGGFWTEAFGTEKDRIFPIASQRRFWQEARVPFTGLDGAHYDDSLMRRLCGCL